MLKILWVKAGGLVPLDSGGKIRSYHILRELSERHAVTLFTFYAEHANDQHGELSSFLDRTIRHTVSLPRDGSVRGLARYGCNLLSARPYQMAKYCRPSIAASLRELLRENRYDVIVCDFLLPAEIIPWGGACPTVIFTHNVEAQIWKRHYQVAKTLWWKAVTWREYHATERAERRYLGQADHILTVSEADRKHFAKFIESGKLSVVPTGVDLDFFQPAADEEDHNSLVFTGSMDWLPNEDGITHFVEKILPRIRSRRPDVSLTVVGRNPSARLLALTRTVPNITVTGRVEDIRPYVKRGAVYIVPLRIGGGTRLKIFEALAMGKAVVSTTVGAEGLPVQPSRNIEIADEPENFAGVVIALLNSPSRRRELGRAGRKTVVEQFSWKSVGKSFEAVLLNASDRNPRKHHRHEATSSETD